MPLATVAILSVGDMGVGIAKVLIAHDYRVITNASDRRYYILILSQILENQLSHSHIRYAAQQPKTARNATASS